MICEKALQIVVEGGLQVWFPLEATGVQTDAISGIIANEVNPGSSTFSAPAGKVGNGALLDKAAFDSTSFGFTTGIIPELAYDSADGFTFCGWARRVSGSTSQNLLCSLVLYADAAGVTTNGSVSMTDAVNLFEVRANDPAPGVCTTTIAHVVAIGTWFFFVVSYDPTTGKVSFQVNNGAVQTSVCNIGTIATSPFGQFQFYYGLINPAGSGQFDEVALFYPMLTQPQIDYVYNLGLGRTPPITLP